MEFIENLTLGIGLAAGLVAVLAVLFWLPIVAVLGAIASGILALVYFASRRRKTWAIRISKRIAWVSLALAAVAAAGHVLLVLVT